MRSKRRAAFAGCLTGVNAHVWVESDSASWFSWYVIAAWHSFTHTADTSSIMTGGSYLAAAD